MAIACVAALEHAPPIPVRRDLRGRPPGKEQLLPGPLQVDAAARGEQIARGDDIQHGVELVGFEGWVEKDKLPLPARSAEKTHRWGDHDLRVGAQQGSAALQGGCDLPVAFHEHCAGGAARECFETQRAAAGVQVEAGRVLDIGGQPVEQAAARPSERGAQAGTGGEAELSPLPLTTDNADFIAGHRIDGEPTTCDRQVGLGRRHTRSLVSEPEYSAAPRGGFWARLKSGLGKTRSQLAEGVGNLLLGAKAIDDDVLAELETALLLTDVGVDATREIMDELASRVKRKELNDTLALHQALSRLLKEMLAPLQKEFAIAPDRRPFVILFVGVNGVGKTTTIGKLARYFRGQGLSLLLAAGDTFRAAAVEQLKTWGDRNQVTVIAQHQGADSASVVYDAVQAARARNTDVVLADTAGRLQAKTNLMEELAKIKRVVNRIDADAPHEVLLVLDAGVGQNALSQVREFDAAVGVTGLVITKLDGTAKGGILFAIARQIAKPVYFVGVGEGLDDLKPFVADEFVDALLARDGTD